jgi:hypothetical protein
LTVEATHKGISKLPIDIDKKVTKLVVPALAEPLLSVDNGEEYMSKAFEDYLQEYAILRKPGAPHSPELNGVAERKNHTISNLVCSNLLSACLPKLFWADAMRHDFFVFDSFPCNTPLGFKTPASILGKPSIDLNILQPFGCLVYYTVPESTQPKLNPKV